MKITFETYQNANPVVKTLFHPELLTYITDFEPALL